MTFAVSLALARAVYNIWKLRVLPSDKKFTGPKLRDEGITRGWIRSLLILPIDRDTYRAMMFRRT